MYEVSPYPTAIVPAHGAIVPVIVLVAGGVGCAFTVTVVPAETHAASVDDLAVTVYVPAGTCVNIPFVLV